MQARGVFKDFCMLCNQILCNFEVLVVVIVALYYVTAKLKSFLLLNGSLCSIEEFGSVFTPNDNMKFALYKTTMRSAKLTLPTIT